ncbi:hypothetical protein [Paraburkholderia youngii]|uniref:hypothetical protein n=1 Tax=Paraburkholderia youngii TaxID=2782701 RepID=UPI003D1F7A89
MGILFDLHFKRLDRLSSGTPAPFNRWKYSSGARRAALRRAVRDRRNMPLPVGYTSGDGADKHTETYMKMRIGEKKGEDVTNLKARLVMLLYRDRMTYRKRLAREEIANRRRPSVKQKINRARRNRELIRMREEQDARFAEIEAQGYDLEQVASASGRHSVSG